MASATGCLTGRSYASPTNRCTARSSSPVWLANSIVDASINTSKSVSARCKSSRHTNVNGCIRASCAASRRWRSSRMLTPGVAGQNPSRPLVAPNGDGFRFAQPILQREYLPWIHDLVRVKRPLERLHSGKCAAVLDLQILHLALTDAVLARTRAVHCNGAQRQALDEAHGARHFIGIVAVGQQRDVE